MTIGLAFAAQGCNFTWPGQKPAETQEDQRQRDEKTRDEVANATEKMKPAIEKASRELGTAAEKAAEEARAAAQGAKEGWERGGHAPVDINSATEKELLELPGITGPTARKIIHGRPYRDKEDLITKGVISHSSFEKIEDQITAK